AWTEQIGPDKSSNISVITDGTHTGTHLDAPLHFVAGGASVEALDVQTLIGPVQVVGIFGRDAITASDLEGAGIAPDTTRLLFKTDNSGRRLLSDAAWHPEYVGIAPDAAAWLVARGVKLVGVDYLSVGPYGDINTQTRQILLGAGVIIVETLNLEDISPGAYFLVALPPKFEGAEGSPCRAVLIEGITEINE
ncbi:MAG: cyclase family protein, partial [Armatimonadota bacterium]|nr:cyclase family protein [Armatimonadota bacterium]